MDLVLTEQLALENEFFVLLISFGHVLKQDVVSAHAQAAQFWNKASCVLLFT